MTIAALRTEISEILSKRAGIAKDIQEIRKTTTGDNAQPLTAEQRSKIGNLQADFDKYSDQVREKEADLRMLEDMDRIDNIMRSGSKDTATRDNPSGKAPTQMSVQDLLVVQRKFMRNYLCRNWEGMRSVMSSPEFRATTPMMSSTIEAGGAVILPMAIYNGILEKERQETVFLRYGNVINMPKAKSLGVPKLETDMDDADWGKEGIEGDTTRDEFNRQELAPKLLTKNIDIAESLLDGDFTDFDLEGFTMRRADYKFNVTLEKAILTGTGVNQPLGLDKLPSARRVNQLTGTSDAYLYTDAINAFTKLRSPYRTKKSCVWVVGTFLYAGIMGCTDDNGRPLWQPSLVPGTPDTFLGRPIIESEFLPSTDPGANKVLGYFGDMSYIWIPRVTQVGVKVLDQPLATKHLVRYRFSQWIDAQWMLDEAFVTLWMND
jgi:HK97 family phage major capsid protein